MVCECDGANAGEDKILCDFVGKRFDGDEEDIGGTNSVWINWCWQSGRERNSLLLRLNTPQANLSVVEGNLIYEPSQYWNSPSLERSYPQRSYLPRPLQLRSVQRRHWLESCHWWAARIHCWAR